MIEFRILGPLEVRDGERTLALGAAKQRGLLVLLLLRANEVVSAGELVDALWEEPPADASHSLQVLVSQVRDVVESDRSRPVVLVTRPPGYLLNVEPDQLDLKRFERLTREGCQALADGQALDSSRKLSEALELWRGEPLADFRYESFAQPAIARLTEIRLGALSERIEADLVLGRHAQLVGELEELVARHPLVERFPSLLMLALYRCGRQADALAVYQNARQTLDDQLGLLPGPALQRLQRAILEQDPALDLAYDRPAGKALASGDDAPQHSILLTPLEEVGLDQLLGLAEPMARSGTVRELIVARLVADAHALEQGVARVHERRDALAARGVLIRATAFTSAAPGQDIARFASQQEVDLLLVDCPPDVLEDGSLGEQIGFVLASAPCDVGLLLARTALPPSGPILVPFGGSEHDWGAFEIGAWIARAREASLQLLGRTESEQGERDASRLLASASLIAQRYLGIHAEPHLVDPGSDDLARATRAAGLLVVGLSDRWQKEGLGEARLALARATQAPVLLVRKGPRPGGLAPPQSFTRFTWSLSAGAAPAANPR